MKRYTLIASIALIVIGFVLARIGDSLPPVTQGGLMGDAVLVQDSILMPIGAILFILGLLALFIALVWYLVALVRDRSKKA